MTEPEESRDASDRTDPIVAPPTANPARVRVPPEGLGRRTDDEEGDPGASGPPPAEEG
ncbi:hypothetical protein Q3W71_29740 [Micromonospora sp. C28SCA-DRY-2]|uniref:hypothetical protein n=1 Tax=Micromonospora sp. C28SCA-DRY-2 TaxID=3059522 RepID=UPI00267626C2|nr:hypothetical protein [Micromonospora sp. C28SCA-DRY-2]MDO3705860.1 hypothetical protein [Micromonospora sp. C28SCA-DRY-2]